VRGGPRSDGRWAMGAGSDGCESDLGAALAQCVGPKASAGETTPGVKPVLVASRSAAQAMSSPVRSWIAGAFEVDFGERRGAGGARGHGDDVGAGPCAFRGVRSAGWADEGTGQCVDEPAAGGMPCRRGAGECGQHGGGAAERREPAVVDGHGVEPGECLGKEENLGAGDEEGILPPVPDAEGVGVCRGAFVNGRSTR
jgi:hypothetical protein